MTKRKLRKMNDWERKQEIRRAASRLNSALNLFGADEIIEGCDNEGAETYVAGLLTPECHCRRGTCDHAFPAWFVAKARTASHALVRLYQQIESL